VAGRGGIEPVGTVVAGVILWAERAGFDIAQDTGPDLDAVSDGEDVGVRADFVRAGKDMQAAENYDGAALAIPPGELVGSL
jgi:hypothetical protein